MPARPEHVPNRRPHGALKAAVLEILLHAGEPLTAHQIRQRFGQDARVPALSTTLTVLERLRSQGSVERAAGETGEHVFSPAPATAEGAAHSMLDTLLRSDDRSSALTQFAGALDADDLEVLRTAIERRRPGRRSR